MLPLSACRHNLSSERRASTACATALPAGYDLADLDLEDMTEDEEDSTPHKRKRQRNNGSRGCTPKKGMDGLCQICNRSRCGGWEGEGGDGSSELKQLWWHASSP